MNLRTIDLIQSPFAKALFNDLFSGSILRLCKLTSQEALDNGIQEMVHTLYTQYGIVAPLFADIGSILLNVLSDCLGFSCFLFFFF